jgi:hypothetical protein
MHADSVSPHSPTHLGPELQRAVPRPFWFSGGARLTLNERAGLPRAPQTATLTMIGARKSIETDGPRPAASDRRRSDLRPSGGRLTASYFAPNPEVGMVRLRVEAAL